MSESGGAAGRLTEAIDRFGGAGRRQIAKWADVVLDRGRGSYVYDRRGDRYLDAVAGYGVASLGHGHPRWVEAVLAQVDRLAVSPFDTAELSRLVAALAELLPPRLSQTALYSGGAEAVEAAIRLAQTATGRAGVLTFGDSFHGRTAGVRYSADPGSAEALALGPAWLRSAPFPACERHDAVSYPDCDESAAASLSELVGRDDLGDVGAVLVEPILGTGGNVPPRRRFLSELRQLCDERGWLLIFDELITGFGRSGPLFAFEGFGAMPDVLVLGKGIGGGVPMSAVCAAPELWRDSALGLPNATGSSFGGNPVSCAAALATVEIVSNREFLAHARTVGERAALRLRELAAASPRVARPRGAGLMLGFDLVDPESGELASTEACAATFRACRDRRLLIMANVPRVRISPPLTIAAAEADELFDILHEVLE